MNVTRTFLAVLLFPVLLVSGQGAPSAPFVPPADPPRYFIVVEKTAAAARYDDSIRQAVFDLVYQGAGGEMGDGSVIEIWIYGQDTATRGFTPEMLMPDNHLTVAQRASAYVRGIPSTGEGDMPKFAEHVRNLASVAFETTIFFISPPETRLDGTSVDREVNEIFDVHAERLAGARKPFITTFRIQDGALATFSVGESALVPSVPPMPPSRVSTSEKERMIADARAALAAAEEAKNPPKIEEVAKAEIPVPVPEAKPPVDLRKIPDDQREGAIILRGNPKKPVESEKSATATAANTAVTADSKENVPAESDETKPETKPAATPEETKTLTKAVEVAVGANEAAALEAANDGTKAPVSNAGDALPQNAEPTNLAVQPQTWLTAGGLLAAGILFFVVAGVLIWLSIRRTRAAAGPSFITRSMNDRKNLKG